MELPDRIGPYMVQRVLGEGAMGKVYLARHPRLGREVAIKLLHERDPGLVARFQREAEVMARIRHEGVVEVYEAGVHEGEPYLVLEFCRGRDLAAVLRERGALPPQEAARLVAEIARGVSAAHVAGVIHRDLKPANVLVDRDGCPKVTDFGIAAARAGRIQSLTESGVILGTPSYMAPEQARDSRSADARSDVYALGAILYECLTGRPPYQGATSLAVLSKVMAGQLEPLPVEVPAALAEVVTCALSLDPGDRFAQAAYLTEALEEALAAEEVGPSSRPRWLAPLVVAGGLLALSGLALASSLAVPSPTPSRSASPAPSGGASPSGSASPAPSESASPASSGGPSPSPISAELPLCRRRAHFLDKQRFLRAKVPELRAAVEAGNPAAMTQLARRFLEGRDVSMDPKKSAAMLVRAAEAGDTEAMVNLVHYYTNGLGVERDPEQAARWTRVAGDLGSYAVLLVRSSGMAPEEVEALRARAWKIARGDAERGDPTATAALLRDRWVVGDLEGMERWLALGLEQGAREAWLLQGYLLRIRGAEAREYADAFQRASELGNVEATCAWARCLLEGTGVPRDVPRGEALLRGLEARDPQGVGLERVRRLFHQGKRTEWWRELEALLRVKPAALLGHRWGDLAIHVLDAIPEIESARRQRALDLLGRFLSRSSPLRTFDERIPYSLGLMVAKQRGPTSYARRLFGRAARLGSTGGAYSYGNLLLREGSEQAAEEGLRWVGKAAERGSSRAWRHLAQMYQRGQHVAEDELRGLDCLARAVELGDEDAVHELASRLIFLGRYAEAAPWAERLRTQGRVSGEVGLSVIRVMCGPTREDAKAGLLELESLASSEREANLALSTMYRLGKGVSPDHAKAEFYLKRGREMTNKKP